MMDENSAGCASEGAGDTLARLGMDGEKWAREFAERCGNLRISWNAPDDEAGTINGETLIGWFSNAIMAGFGAAPTISQDVPAPAAVTAEVRERFEAFVRPWRKGIAMLHDAQSHRHMCMVKPVAGGDVHEWAAAEMSALRAALSAATPLQSDLECFL